MDNEEIGFEYDFCGWATRNGLKCADGRTIVRDAFKHNDGDIVPLVWNHGHNDPNNVLGHALLENRDEGVYVYGSFNDTPSANNAREFIQHGDITSLSIYANKLQQDSSRNVMHGDIKEVSLVLAGANPGAYIEDVIVHGDTDGGSIIYSDDYIEETDDLEHAEYDEYDEEYDEYDEYDEELEHAEDSDETVEDVFNTLTDKQKNVVYYMLGQALEGEKNNEEDEGDDEDMKHNVFNNDENYNEDEVLTHSEIETIIADAKRYGSLKESVLSHGITDIEFLFPDATNLNKVPEFIKRDTGWVASVINGTKHTPFSRVKSTFANITEDEARAKGYIKGKLKKEEVFSLLKRTTDPQTIYKKQKLDRDDVIDITDFDIVSWLKAEMRMMLDEEIARAVLIGDGRLTSDEDHISHSHIRPIFNDADLYTIKAVTTANADADSAAKAKDFIKTAIKSRKNYKGSGNPALYTTEDMLTDCLLLEDSIGRLLYESEAQLAKTLRVSKIITVPVMEGQKGSNGGDLLGLIVNLQDYNIGADKGGAVSMFEDFDIDYNQQKYLIETRCSGALIKPYSAIAIETAKN